MGYKTIKRTAQSEFVEKKSVFIGTAKRVFTEEEAKAFIDEVRLKYKDARHHVYAYILGEDMSVQRYSDDGEPQGTGGIPMLEVMRRNELRNACVVVTRYFGGILLGAGGLTRAYVKGAADAIKESGVVERVSGHEVVMTIDYDLLGKIQYFLKEKNHKIENLVYTDKVELTLYLETMETSSIVENIMNISSAKAEIIIGDEELFYKDQEGLQKEFE